MAPVATYIIEHMGWRYVFTYGGMAMGIMAVLASFCLKIPPLGWMPKGYTPPKESPSSAIMVARDYSHHESYKTRQFWLLYIAYFCGSFAGLMVIEHIIGHGRDQGVAPMLATYAASWLATTNALARILVGHLADRIGTRLSFVGVFVLQVVAVSLLYPSGKVYWALWAVAALIGWNYGAMFTLFPATCLQYFGPTAQGSNNVLLFTSWGLAGFAGPYVGVWLKDVTGSYCAPFIVAAIIVGISVIIMACIKEPQKKAVLPAQNIDTASRETDHASCCIRYTS